MSITPNREELAGREMGKRLLAVATVAALLAPSVQPAPAGAAPANGATGDASSNRRVEPNAKKAPATAAEAKAQLDAAQKTADDAQRAYDVAAAAAEANGAYDDAVATSTAAQAALRRSTAAADAAKQAYDAAQRAYEQAQTQVDTPEAEAARAELAAAQVALDAAQRDARGPSGQEGRRRAAEQGSVRLLCLDRRPVGRGHPEERAVRCRDASGRGERCLAHRQRQLRVPVH